MPPVLDHPETPAAQIRPASLGVIPQAIAEPPGLLALEGGSVYPGRIAGGLRPVHGDLIFTTAATGWGEILTDPSYAGQIVVLTHPMVGNYRIRDEELESSRVQVRGVVVSRLIDPPVGPGRSFREMLAEAGVPAVVGVDTRAVTLEIQRGVRRRAVIVPAVEAAVGTHEAAAAVEAAATSPRWEDVDHVAAVAPRAPYRLAAAGARRGLAAVLDMGVKRSLLAAFTGRGYEIAAYPHDADASVLLDARPDLVVLSPGPGDPARMGPQIETVRRLADSAAAGGPPVFGVCLGHQLLALAGGAKTRRLAVGHHGGNHAVVDAEGRVDIGAHNHEVTVIDDEALAAAGYRVTHRDVSDGSVEGLAHRSERIVSVQFHPEGAPGPVDGARVFDTPLA